MCTYGRRRLTERADRRARCRACRGERRGQEAASRVNGRIFVAMSGGVDSSVAAAILADRGEDVVGVWMRLVPAGSNADAPRCCGPDEAGGEARPPRAPRGRPCLAPRLAGGVGGRG